MEIYSKSKRSSENVIWGVAEICLWDFFPNAWTQNGSLWSQLQTKQTLQSLTKTSLEAWNFQNKRKWPLNASDKNNATQDSRTNKKHCRWCFHLSPSNKPNKNFDDQTWAFGKVRNCILGFNQLLSNEQKRFCNCLSSRFMQFVNEDRCLPWTLPARISALLLTTGMMERSVVPLLLS